MRASPIGRRFLLVVLVIAFCSSAHPEDHSPPALLEFTPSLSDPNHAATIHVQRGASLIGVAMTTTLTIDGTDVAKLKNGQQITFLVNPGEHLLGLKSKGNDPIGGPLTLGLVRPNRWRESATIFEAGKIYIFRIQSDANWEWQLNRSSH